LDVVKNEPAGKTRRPIVKKKKKKHISQSKPVGTKTLGANWKKKSGEKECRKS